MAKGNLLACLPVILANEGGLSMVRSDPGNWTGGKVGVGTLRGTNMGIAASAHPTLDIAHLTEPEVATIYKDDYWSPAGCEVLPAGLDLSHFDGTVNSGRGNSAKWLAKARQDAGASTSGSIHAYAAARLGSLEHFKTWVTFGKGWSARVAGVEAKSLTMALGSAAPAAIAKAGAAAATKAKAASAAAHASTAVAAATAATGAAAAHPAAGLVTGIVFALVSLWSAFHASTASARAAALATHAAA